METVFDSVNIAARSLYADSDAAVKRYAALADKFSENFGDSKEAYYFSAPGRIEICGNHTDHQRGRVLTSAIEHDIAALASKNDSGLLRVISVGQRMFTVEAMDTAVRRNETGRSAGMVRGISAGFLNADGKSGGADICIMSDVPTGSGISSSAAFEMLIATVINEFYNDGAFSPVQMAKIGQYAESMYFGKPCGLMDQCASACGGCIGIDFSGGNTEINTVSMACVTDKYDIFIVHGGGNHAKLGREYASIVDEMRSVAKYFGKSLLSEVDETQFMAEMRKVRSSCDDRAVLRAMHYYSENNRVSTAQAALEANDAERFLALINESGESSLLLLQNVYLENMRDKSVALALALTKKFFRDKGIYGACRIHGGGFSGTILAFVPHEHADEYKEYMESCLDAGSAYIVISRDRGACAVCRL